MHSYIHTYIHTYTHQPMHVCTYNPYRMPVVLDERGASKECSAVMKMTCELLVGRSEGVFSYSVRTYVISCGNTCVPTYGRKYILY